MGAAVQFTKSKEFKKLLEKGKDQSYLTPEEIKYCGSSGSRSNFRSS